jgi:PAS domain S-box-containing protein
MSATDCAKLGRREEQFRLLLAAAPDAIVVARRNGKIVLVNSQTEKLFGYSEEQLLGKRVEMLMPKRFRHGHVKHRREYFSQPSVRSMGAGLELYGLRKNGTEFPADINLRPLETGREALVCSSIRDVTDRK